MNNSAIVLSFCSLAANADLKTMILESRKNFDRRDLKVQERNKTQR